MAYSLTSITGSDTVGQAFIKVNANLNKQIVSGFTSGNTLRLVSKDGTQEIISLSAITATGAITGITSAGTANILLLSGTVVNSNLIQKSISAGTNITITENNNTLTFNSSASGGGSGTITGATNNGGGISVYQSATTSTLAFRTLSAGTNVTITTGSTGLITIAATGGSSTGLTTASTVGGGVSLISAITSNNLQLNSISGTAGMVVNAASNGLITFRGPNTANRVFVTDASGNMVNSGSLQTDNTNGTLGINVAASTTSRLLLPAQTTAISPLRFTTSSTAISSPVNGDTWYLTAGDRLQFRKNAVTTDFIFKDNNITLTSTTGQRVVEVSSGGTLSATRFFQSFGVFNSVTTTTITNTTSETSIIPTGTSIIGSATLQASTSLTPNLVTGKKYRFTANGTISTKNSAAGTLNIKVKIGSSVICTSSALTLANNVNTPNVFEINCTFTVRTQGVSGTVIGAGLLHSDITFHTGSADVYALYNQGVVTIDTTSDKVFDVTAQFGTADATNTLTINEATLEYLN